MSMFENGNFTGHEHEKDELYLGMKFQIENRVSFIITGEMVDKN